MNNFNLKRILKNSILFVVAVMSLLTLCFTLLKFSVSSEGKMVENGFTFLSFESDFIPKGYGYDWGISLLGTFSLIQLIVSIIAIGLSIFAFFSKSGKTFAVAIITIALSISILYLIEGLLFKNIVITELGSELGSEAKEYFKTSCFIPLILQAVLVGTYFVVSYIVPEDASINNNTTGYKTTTVTVNMQKQSNKVELLKQYKELFDTGVITQEEFDEKKKEIL